MWSISVRDSALHPTSSGARDPTNAVTGILSYVQHEFEL